MTNQAMEEFIKNGTALDLSKCPRNDAGDYVLGPLNEQELDHLFCDAATEQWIWSIGVNKATGQFLASTTAKFYQHPDYDCVWLR